MKTLRPYQLDLVADLRREYAADRARVLLQLDTGGGKTILAAHMVRNAVAKGRRVLWLVDSRSLVLQTSRVFREEGIAHGVVMAGCRSDWREPVQVASKDTAVARGLKRAEERRVQLPPADLVVTDEAHKSMARWYRELLGRYPDAWHLGLTATPALGDGRGMDGFWESLVCGPPTSKLIGMGAIVPCRVYAPARPDLKGLRANADGEYSRKALEARMDRPRLVGDVVDHYQRIAYGRPAMVSASGVNHSLHLCAQFNEAGVPAEHIDANSPDEVREAVFGRIKSGETLVVCQVGVMGVGVDIPELSCWVNACPTKSLVKYRQAVGRVKRPSAGKEYALVLDHGGTTLALGLPDDDVEWKLEGEERVQDRQAKRVQEGKVKAPLVCPKCFLAFSGMAQCPGCGHALARQGRKVDQQQGLLVEVTGDREAWGTAEWEAAAKNERVWRKCIGVAAKKGHTVAYANARFRRETGRWPDDCGVGERIGVRISSIGKTPAAELYAQHYAKNREAV